MNIIVTMKDRFLSGWGRAKNRTSIYAIVCDDNDQADIIIGNAMKRSDMEDIKYIDNVPDDMIDEVLDKKFNENRYKVDCVTYGSLGDGWKLPL